MEVSRVELAAIECLSGTKRQLPHTFFSLSPSEKASYDSFRARHKKIELSYLFSTGDENLSCESHLVYQSRDDNIYERYVVYDLFEKIAEGKKQDGINFSIFSLSSDYLYFASTDLAMRLMCFIKNTLKKVGPDTMKELKTLYGEYVNQCRKGESSDTKLQQEVFKKAYESKLEKAVKIYEFNESLFQPVGPSETIH